MPGYLHPFAREQLDIVGHILLDIESGFDFCPGIFTEAPALTRHRRSDARRLHALHHGRIAGLTVLHRRLISGYPAPRAGILRS